MSLFAAPSIAAPRGLLHEFPAGKMTRMGNTVTPLPNKGSIRVFVDQADQMVHLQWIDSLTGKAEDDLLIFPDDATFFKTTQSKDRVYILKFKSGRKLFFWMQDKTDTSDEKNCRYVNLALNDRPALEAEKKKKKDEARLSSENMALLTQLLLGGSSDEGMVKEERKPMKLKNYGGVKAIFGEKPHGVTNYESLKKFVEGLNKFDEIIRKKEIDLHTEFEFQQKDNDGVVELMEHINKENEEDNEVPDMDIDDIKAFLDE